MQRTLLFLAYFFIYANCLAQQTNLSFQHYTMKDGLTDNYIRNLFQDNRGYLWINTNEGFNRFDRNSFRRFFQIENNTDSFIKHFPFWFNLNTG